MNEGKRLFVWTRLVVKRVTFAWAKSNNNDDYDDVMVNSPKPKLHPTHATDQIHWLSILTAVLLLPKHH